MINNVSSKGYLFIGNSPKISVDELMSTSPLPIGSFRRSSLFAAKELGFKLFCGVSRFFPEKIKCLTPGYDITFYNANVYRNIFAFKDNWIAYKNACALLDKYPEIEIIHCNTPIGGIIGRIIGYKYKKKVLYMVHGFHFYSGAPIINWLIYYPIERLLFKITDVLITINTEDFNRVKKIRIRNNGNKYFVPGVGIDLEQFKQQRDNRIDIRRKLDIPLDTILLIAVGRLDKNKNNALIINAFSKINASNVHLIVCGEGDQRSKLQKQVLELNLSAKVHLLGNKDNIIDFYNASDIFVMGSFREGLSRSIMEAMALGLPCVVSKIRGNIDLIKDGEGGYCISPHDADSYARALDKLIYNKALRINFGKYNKYRIKAYSDVEVKKCMVEIFKNEFL